MSACLLKKVFLVILSVLLVFSLSACNSREEAKEESEPVQKTYPLHTIGVGDTIRNDTVVITIDQVGSADQLLPSDPTGYIYMTQPDKENETYFYATGTIKNISGETVSIGGLYSRLEFDGKYHYDATIRQDIDGDFFFGPIKPLETIRYYVFASVPDEMADSYTTCKIQFAFRDDFKYVINTGFDRYENRYEITLSRDAIPHVNPGRTPDPYTF